MITLFTEEEEKDLPKWCEEQSELREQRITLVLRLLWLIAIGAMVTVGLALNNIAFPWLFGVAVVCSLVWLSHAIVICTNTIREN